MEEEEASEGMEEFSFVSAHLSAFKVSLTGDNL